MRTNSTFSKNLLRLLLFLAFAFFTFCHFSLKPVGVDAGLHMYGSLLISKGLFPYENLWNNKPPLIYVLGSIGFLFKSNPFIGVRLLEVFAFVLNLFLLNKILNFARVQQPLTYLLCFSITYLACWDGGFLTETFTIPINLLAIYLFLKRNRYFGFFASLCWITLFLLKQNAMFVVTGIILIDIFSDYRQVKKIKKLLSYFLSFSIFILVILFFLKKLGLWNEFIDQAFIYNSEYVAHPSLYRAIVDHLIRNSFLSVRGVSFLMIFNACILVTLWKYWRSYKTSHYFSLKDKLLVSSILIYLGSYTFVYISGRTDAHYFMLLLVPAAFIAGYYIVETSIGKVALAALSVYAVIVNVKSVRYYEKVYSNMETAASYIRSNSTANDFILVAGFGNQYLHIVSDRLSPTRFVMPLLENNGYNTEYRRILSADLSNHPPLFIVLNKNNYRTLNTNDFYSHTIAEELKTYSLGFENEKYIVYKRCNQMAGPIK